MRRVVLRLFLVGLVLAPATAAASGPVRAELLIMGPGDEVYARYGHAALRIVGPGRQDRVFNFGITRFDRPNYVADFLGGRVIFWGNVKPFDRVIRRYREDDRTFLRYLLNLTPEQADALRRKVEWAVAPENREYRYDTFRDNCATRLRDYIDEVTGGAVRAALGDVPSGRSYHDDVRVAFANLPALLLALEIVPGVEMDAPRTVWEMAYRPEALGEALRRVTVEIDGRRVPLASEPIVAHARAGPDPLLGWPDRGRAFLWIWAAGLALLGVLLGGAGRRWRAAGIVLWVIPSSLLGALLVFVELWTDWPDMKRNWLVLGFVATDLWLLRPAWKIARGKAETGGDAATSYVVVRLGLMAGITALGVFVPALHGNLPPRVLALAGLFLCLRCLGGARWRPRAAVS